MADTPTSTWPDTTFAAPVPVSSSITSSSSKSASVSSTAPVFSPLIIISNPSACSPSAGGNHRCPLVKVPSIVELAVRSGSCDVSESVGAYLLFLGSKLTSAEDNLVPTYVALFPTVTDARTSLVLFLLPNAGFDSDGADDRLFIVP